MTTQVTLEEVWRLFKDTDERFKDTAERFKATDERFKDTAERFKATDERFKATDERFKDTDERFKDTDERMARLSEAADRRQAETVASLRELSRQMGRFSNQVGEFAEAMVVPAAKKIFLSRGIPVHAVSRNIEGERDGKAIEIDILVVNSDHAVVVEVKNRPKIEHVNEHLERLAAFKEVFPMYRDYKLLGAIAGITVDDNVARYAYRRGLFVLGQNGETVSILNDDHFNPTVW